MKRSVFFLSDRTGITAETLAHSLLTQFEDVEFKQHNLPFLDNVEKAEAAVETINQAAEDDGAPPLLFR
ncbi:kinase/pyrophosphorylase [Solemya pervernicosa gill symbiont]|nr:kinase/pyrophosphorylase [Solemya pervernicosa gill symbiont]